MSPATPRGPLRARQSRSLVVTPCRYVESVMRTDAGMPDPAPADDAAAGERGGPLVQGKALTKRFGDQVAVDGIDFAVQPGRGVRLPRAQRRGQDHDHAHDRLRVAHHRRRASGCWAWTRAHDGAGDPGPPRRGPPGGQPRHRAHRRGTTSSSTAATSACRWPIIRERATELLDFARLDDRRDSRVDPLSGGMKRRLTIARALINQPELVLLDEPTTGLDPQARHLLWERLYRLKREGVTLVLTTHYMDEAEQLCDRLVIMDEGRIVAEGSPRQLIDRYSTREVVELRFARPSSRTTALPRLDGDGRAGRAAGRPGAHLHRRRRRHRWPGVSRRRHPPRLGAGPAQLARGRVPPAHRADAR